jgi:hypothetical protein
VRTVTLGLFLAVSTGILLGVAAAARTDLLLWARAGLFALLGLVLLRSLRRAPAPGEACRSCGRARLGDAFCLHCGTYPKPSPR